MKSYHDCPGRSSRGFTLLELLLAAALTASLVVILLAMATRAIELWERSAGQIEATRIGQRVLDQLEDDLECSGPVEPRVPWLTAQIGGSPGDSSIRLGGGSVGADRYGPGAMVLRLVTANQSLGRADESPLPVVVTYRITRLPVGQEGAAVWLLCRFEADPTASFQSGFDLNADNPSEAGSANSPGEDPGLAPLLRAALGMGVVDFGIRVVAGDETLFPATPDARELTLRGRDGGGGALEIKAMVRILTPRGAARVAAISGGVMVGNAWQAVEQGSVVVTRRIRIVGAGP